MTPEELSVLYLAGKSLRLDSFTIFTKAAFYGVFVVLNGLTIFQLTFVLIILVEPRLTHPVHSHRRVVSLSAKLLITMIVILTLITTIEVARSLAIIVINVETIVMGTRTSDGILDDGLMDERQRVASATLRPIFAISSWTTGISFLCGDIIMVWRASQLYRSRSYACYSLLVIIIIDACITFTSGTLSTRAYIIHNITGVELIPDPNEKRYVVAFYNLAYWWSLVSNAYATTLVAIKARQHLVKTKRVGVKSSVGPALILFVETGFGFCLMQLAFCILWQIALPPYNIPLDCFYVAVLFTSAIYPSAIILILRYRLSDIDNSNTLYSESRVTASTNKANALAPIQLTRLDNTNGSIGLRSFNGGKDHNSGKDVESLASPDAEASGSWK